MKQILPRSLAVVLGLLAGLIFAGSLPAARAQPAPAERTKNPDAPAAKPKPAQSKPGDESRDLAMARLSLEQARQRYGEQHPEVMELRSRVEILEALEPRKFNLDFSGGPISKLLDAVATNPGVSFSIVNTVATDLAAELPAFSLRNVTVQTVMEVARKLLFSRGFELAPVSVEKNSVICMLERQPSAKSQPAAPKSDFASYQLAPYLAQQSVDDIISAIRTAWELDPNHDKNDLRLKYHPATTMLLVSGAQNEAIYVTQRVLSELKRAPKAEPVPPEKK